MVSRLYGSDSLIRKNGFMFHINKFFLKNALGIRQPVGYVVKESPKFDNGIAETQIYNFFTLCLITNYLRDFHFVLTKNMYLLDVA